MLNEIKTYEFLESVGIVTFTAALVTMILTSIVKLILKQAKVITSNTDATRKDVILSRVGRVIGLISYTGLYVLDVMYIQKTNIVIDIKLVTSLISGGTLTLVISKGLYTMIRQMEKKNSVYEKLEVAEQTISELSTIANTNKTEQIENINSNVTDSGAQAGPCSSDATRCGAFKLGEKK